MERQDSVGCIKISGYGPEGLAGLFGVRAHVLSGGTCVLQKNTGISINGIYK